MGVGATSQGFEHREWSLAWRRRAEHEERRSFHLCQQPFRVGFAGVM